MFYLMGSETMNANTSNQLKAKRNVDKQFNNLQRKHAPLRTELIPFPQNVQDTTPQTPVINYFFFLKYYLTAVSFFKGTLLLLEENSYREFLKYIRNAIIKTLLLNLFSWRFQKKDQANSCWSLPQQAGLGEYLTAHISSFIFIKRCISLAMSKHTNLTISFHWPSI